MNNKKNYGKGKRREIIKTLLAAGCIPYRAIPLLTPNKETYYKKIRDMIKEGVVIKYSFSGTPAVLLNNENYAENLDKFDAGEFSPGLYDYYERYGYLDSKKLRFDTETVNKKRIIRNAESQIFFRSIYAEENPANEIAALKKITAKGKNAFYNMREMKSNGNWIETMGDLEDDADEKFYHDVAKKKLTRSHANGLAVTEGGSYVVYDVDKELRKFSYVELKVRYYSQQMLQTKGLKENRSEVKGAVLLTDGYNTQKKYIRPENDSQEMRISRFFECYDHIYALPLTKEGQMLMQMMSEEGWDKKLYRAYVGDKPRANTCPVDCDGEDDKGYWFVYCVPDIKRLRTFLNAAELGDKNEFHIVCFDIQKEFIKSVSSNNCHIYTIPFEQWRKKNEK